MKLQDVFSVRSFLFPGAGRLTHFLHGCIVIPDGVVARTGTNRVAIDLCVVLVAHLFYFDAVPPDVGSTVNTEQVLEAVVVEGDELVILLNLSWWLQDFVVEGVVVERQDVLELMPLNDAEVAERCLRVDGPWWSLFDYWWPGLDLVALFALRRLVRWP